MTDETTEERLLITFEEAWSLARMVPSPENVKAHTAARADLLEALAKARQIAALPCKGGGALDALARHTNWELSYGYPDRESEGEWQVHSVNGGVNDREWTLIGCGQTPEGALLTALSRQGGE